jgi:hypothetical protein
MKTSSQENGINKRKQISDLLNELKIWCNSPSNKSILKLIKFENEFDENLYDFLNKVINKLLTNSHENHLDDELINK